MPVPEQRGACSDVALCLKSRFVLMRSECCRCRRPTTPTEPSSRSEEEGCFARGAADLPFSSLPAAACAAADMISSAPSQISFPAERQSARRFAASA